MSEPFSLLQGWSGSVEAGLNGSEGNTRIFNFRGGAHAERKMDLTITKFDLSVAFSRERETVTQNRGEATLRNDWKLSETSPWRYYLTGSCEYDQFMAWDARLSLTNGLGYALIERPGTLLLGRIGVGAFREVGGPDNRTHPEGNLGIDFEHRLTPRQKLTSSVDYYPDFLDLSEYRLKTTAAWEVLIDPEEKLSLKLGFEHRYDSSLTGGSRNDLDYFMLLSWSF